jgi:hypothetical protein
VDNDQQLETIKKIIRETETKVDGLDPEQGSALSYYALGYQKIKQVVEAEKGPVTC